MCDSPLQNVSSLFLSSGVVLLEDQSWQPFDTIVAEKLEHVMGSLIKIPTVFLRAKETRAVEQLLSTGKRFLARLSGKVLHCSPCFNQCFVQSVPGQISSYKSKEAFYLISQPREGSELSWGVSFFIRACAF